jgi:tRNA pseudouridine13 synthase
VEDLPGTQIRIEAGEVTVAGPLLGPKAMRAKDEAQRFESAVWAQMGLSDDWLALQSVVTQGARRAACVPLLEPNWAETGDGIALGFALPKGSYATVVLDSVFPGQIEDFAKAPA